ncbi:MAG: sulfatase-like hydrolase/transferase [Rubripirellula sp.]|nr:sulfatase-like hydrolase/transferase [Rubripirellula sp.]
MKIAVLLLTFVFAQTAICGSQSQSQSDKTTRPPNILFIVSDDHGWGDLPANWDQTEVRLPALEALAAKGIRFPNYHTVPLCGPSRACMFTGQYSTENGMWRGPGQQPLGSPGYRGIKRDVKMLSEHLSEAGYKTGAFGKWHMGSLVGEVPSDRGFDEFRGFLGGAHSYWINEARSKFMHNRQPDRTSKGHATELFTGWAEEFIRESAIEDKPFFCYLAYNAVHGPLRTDDSKPASAPEAWVKKTLDRGVSFLRSDYVAILEHMDHNIGRLIDTLDELNVAENTLIVFVSDNGGCTMEEAAAGGRFPGNNGPLRGGKGTTHQGGLNVPFLMNWKGKLSEGMVSDEQVMHCDIFATLLDAATIPVPVTNGKNPVRGMSLMPHMLSAGRKTIPERTMIFELWGNIGLRKGNYKLWSDLGREHSPDWEALSAKLEQSNLALFDLSQDVAEEIDLRLELPEIYSSLKTELIDHLANINSEYPGERTPEVLNREAPKLPKTATAPMPKRRTPDQFFKSRDRNGDGAITLEEYIGDPKTRNVPALTKRFTKIDSNGDGKVQLDELKTQVK